MKKGFSLEPNIVKQIEQMADESHRSHSAIVEMGIGLLLEQPEFCHLRQPPIQPRKHNSKSVAQKTQERVAA